MSKKENATSIYKGVSRHIDRSQKVYWRSQKQYKKKKYKATRDTEREAALAYDKTCISLGLDPVNILKKK